MITGHSVAQIRTKRYKKWLRSNSRILVPDDHLIAKLASRRFRLIKGRLPLLLGKNFSHSDHCLKKFSPHLLLLCINATRDLPTHTAIKVQPTQAMFLIIARSILRRDITSTMALTTMLLLIQWVELIIVRHLSIAFFFALTDQPCRH